MGPLSASTKTRPPISILVALVLATASLAGGGTIPPEPPLGLEAPSMEVQSDRLLLLSDVSWTPANPGSPFVYYMTAWIMRASGGSYTLEPYTGELEFHYRGAPGAPDQPYVPGQLSLAEGGWPPFVLVAGSFTQQAVDGRVRVVVTSSVGVGAYVFSARPAEMEDIAWSQWVQVNNGTRYGLFDMRDYWSLHAGDSWTFDGRQSLPSVKAVSSTSTIYNFYETCDGACPEPPIGEPGDANHGNFVQLFLKTRDQGYIGYQNPWSPNIWGSGNMRCALWGWEPEADNADDGEWVSYTAHECWFRPASQEPPPANDPIFDPLSETKGNYWNAPASPQPTCKCPSSGCPGTGSDLCWNRKSYKNGPEYQPPETDRSYDLTNYILAPEYVGTGWGIGVRKNAAGRYWYAWANRLDEDDLTMIPGLDDTMISGDLLQLRFWEVTSQGTGHREDWFGDGDGVLRIEDRLFRNGIGKTYQHPDGTHTQIMQQPHFCMTRQGLGICPGVR